MNTPSNKSLVLFDGICNLCNASVRFILKHDTGKRFVFSSLQSDAAKDTLLHYNFKNFDTNTIILIDEEKVYTESDAVLRILSYLGYPYKGLSYFHRIPGDVRNSIYRFIAKNRYKWFGKKHSCVYSIHPYNDRFIS